MSDYEIDELRRIRHQISVEHDHDLRKLAEHYRNGEKELRESVRFKFAEKEVRKREFIRCSEQWRHPVFVSIDRGNLCKILTEVEFHAPGELEFQTD